MTIPNQHRKGNLAVIAVRFDVDETQAHVPTAGLALIWSNLPEEPSSGRIHPHVAVYRSVLRRAAIGIPST